MKAQDKEKLLVRARKAEKKARKADRKVTRALYRRAIDGDVAAAIFWLKKG